MNPTPERLRHVDTSWMVVGICRQYPPDTFFPKDGVGVERAIRICKECPVLQQCLEYALDNRMDHGVWGGQSERERRRAIRSRRNSIA
jgi:WhiB family redox-sensing transcriptional regulator